LAWAAVLTLLPASLAQAQYAPVGSGPYFPRPVMPQYYHPQHQQPTMPAQQGVQPVGNVVIQDSVGYGPAIAGYESEPVYVDQAPKAQQVSHTSNASTVMALEARLAELEARLASYNHSPMSSSACCAPMAGCGTGCCPKKEEKVGGPIAGAELLFLKPHFGENDTLQVTSFPGAGGAGPTNASTRGFDFDYDPAFRVYTGWVNAQGTGVVARYFLFDQSADDFSFAGDGTGTTIGTFNYQAAQGVVATPGIGRGGVVGLGGAGPTTFDATYGLKVQSLDLEGLQEFNIGRANMTVSGGLRYMRIEHMVRATGEVFPNPNPLGGAATGPFAFAADKTFEGLGPTVAIAARAPVFDSNFAITSSLRGSAVYGAGKDRYGYDVVDIGIPDVTFRNESDDLVGVIELNLGAEYSRKMGNYRFFGRLGGEAQYYVGGGSPLTQDNVRAAEEADFGMVGYNLSVGVAR
jgi:hypothetical protein